MGGYGSIQPILKNNKQLLRKKSLFKDKKKIVKPEKGELEFRECSEEEFLLLKEKLKKKAKRRKLINYVIAVLAVVIISFITVFIISANNAYRKKIQENNLKIKGEQIAVYMEKGDTFYHSYHYKNALFFYHKAEELSPENSLIKMKINNCYRNRCETEGLDCEKIKKLNSE